MPYWSVYCVWCGGYIADALLQCVPAARQAEAAFRQLVQFRPGAALACPYCNGLIGFDDQGQLRAAEPGWPVFRYGLAELELKRDQDGEPPTTPLADWALRYRFTRPGSNQPLRNYRYAEQSPPDETVP